MVENGGEENLDGDMDEDDDGEEEDGDQCCATIAEVPRVELKALLGNGGFVCNGIRCTCRSEITSLMRSIKLCKNKKFKFTYEDGDRWHKLHPCCQKGWDQKIATFQGRFSVRWWDFP